MAMDSCTALYDRFRGRFESQGWHTLEACPCPGGRWPSVQHRSLLRPRAQCRALLEDRHQTADGHLARTLHVGTL